MNGYVGLLSCCVLVIAANIGRLSNSFVPLHDSLQAFQVFHFQYSAVLHTGRFAEWLPFNTWGMPSDYWRLCAIGPLSYVAIYAGAALRSTETLLLFKLSIAGEQLIYGLGCYALATRLCRTQLAANVASIGAVATADWTQQLWWSFRIYSWLPLVLWLLLRARDTGRGHYLWLAGTVSIVSLIGNLPYYAPLYVLLLSAFSAPLIFNQPRLLSVFVDRSRAMVLSLGLFVALAAGYAYLVFHCLGHVDSLDVAGRDPITRQVPVSVFLNHGGHPDARVLGQLLLGWPVHGSWSSYPDQVIYAGLLPLALAPVGAVYGRSPEARALKYMFGVGLLLSLGGLVAAVLYYFPGMSLFRHGGLLYPLLRMPVVLLAAIGLDHLVTHGERRHVVCAGALLLLWAEVLGLFRDVIGMGFARAVSDIVPAAALLRLAAYAVALAAVASAYRWGPIGVNSSEAASRRRWFWLVVAYAIDVYSFHAVSTLTTPWAPEHVEATRAVAARDPRHLVQRHRSPTGRSEEKLITWAATATQRLYQTTEDFLQAGTCDREYFTPLAMTRVRALLRQLDALEPSAGPRRSALQSIIGCGTSAVRLTANLDPAFPSAGTGRLGTVRPTHVEPDRVSFAVDVAAPSAWLVYVDAAHPDWSATIDGRRATLSVAYGAFKSIRVRRGQHIVEMSFRPGFRSSSVTAALAAAFGLAALIYLAAVTRSRR